MINLEIKDSWDSFETIILKRKRGPLFQYNLRIKRVLSYIILRYEC